MILIGIGFAKGCKKVNLKSVLTALKVTLGEILSLNKKNIVIYRII